MKEQSFEDEVMRILEETPSARKALLENHENLLRVADYCCSNYLQSGDGSLKALEETKNFTTQSLASVAYQISSLAGSVLSLLDAQTNQLRHMESSINLIGQTVEMHKEKVSRREIGVFTAARRVPRCHKILPPLLAAGSKPRPPYSRRPISYQQLDGIGHGIKVSGKQAERAALSRSSSRSSKAPVQCPVAPPVSGSSFGRPVAPPTLPAPPAPPESDIINKLLDDAPPPPPAANQMSVQEDEVTLTTPPPPPPPPPPSGDPTNHSAPPPAPPLCLETVVEEGIFPAPSPPPPPSEDDGFPPLTNDGSELPAPPPPPNQELDVTLPSNRRRPRSPPRSVSLRVRSGPASRCRFTRSLFLPAVQSLMIPPPPAYPPPPCSSLPPPPPAPCCPPPSSARLCLPARLQHLDLELPAMPPTLLLDDQGFFDDIMPPLPPPVDYDTDAPPIYLEKVEALYNYDASKPDDLSLSEGDIIYLTHRHDDGWCEGYLRGNSGFFPQNYVQSCG
ncbi:ABI family, member 3a isoform X2 [Trematomus bernacchii]|uniref:ABI family, member 3a isoform X2 n=1 Tax=Trematomus bernacchii TaxID=40690 RepID=UPI00146E06AA|nr:ABI family, member 3a isoform X2 [Trematomus bernacchii]